MSNISGPLHGNIPSRRPRSQLGPACSALGLVALIGCGGKAVAASGSLGQLALRLSAISAKAEDYRLTDASFRYSGAAQGTLDVPEGEPNFRAILPVGEYSLELLDGWRLQRDTAAGFVPIAAVLTSDNPAPFTILPSQISPLAFQFQTGGGLVGTEGVLDLSVGVDDSADESAGNGCPHEFCGPISIDFEDQPTGTVLSDQYRDYFGFSTPAAAPVVVRVIAPTGGHSVCADPASSSQCHFELDIDFTHPVEDLSLTLVNSSTTIVTHGLGSSTRTVLSTSVQSFGDLHEVTRVQVIPIGPLGSVRALEFNLIPRVD